MAEINEHMKPWTREITQEEWDAIFNGPQIIKGGPRMSYQHRAPCDGDCGETCWGECPYDASDDNVEIPPIDDPFDEEKCSCGNNPTVPESWDPGARRVCARCGTPQP